RAFLAEHRDRWRPALVAQSWTGFDRDFSREIGAKGWVGMTWPKEYGGAERSALERYVVIEEMLAVGAPVGCHWIADRQSGPLILRVGTEAQKRHYLPRIVRGDCCFCIGLSEPDSGSDLASIRTKAERTDTGWTLTGRKIWTTNAHHADYMIALVRTSGGPQDRHKGLSQVIVDLTLPGVEIRRIHDMTGEAHFNEVTFDGVELPEDALLGVEGEGWAQGMAELAFERSGPDRYMSAFPLFRLTVDEASRQAGNDGPDRLAARRVGQTIAEMATLREMSVSVAGMLDQGEDPAQEAAVIKELGVNLEQSMPEMTRELTGAPAGVTDSALAEMRAELQQLAPTFSLRGGTREIVRGIMARGLGLR
ncbi:MAG: acyl-CoA dehydrogenase family protein, partial [Pseudomonadota bacterium]